MKISDSLNYDKPTFSLEVLPPAKGQDIKVIFENIDPIAQYNPAFISITYHRDEVVYKHLKTGEIEERIVRKRPGTVAVAAALKYRYGIPVVPHLICGGATKEENENILIDLNFLGIENVLVLRGDPQKYERSFIPKASGHEYALELLKQVQHMNSGHYLDAELINPAATDFACGVAAYPEKHPEAPNLEYDLLFLKQKADAGAKYAITQMFFDNQKYYDFRKRCCDLGINIPIIPGIKPLTMKKHLTLLPQTFQTILPEALVKEVLKCKNDKEVRQVGIEWAVYQSKDLLKNKVADIHYFTMGKSDNIIEIVTQVF